MPDVSIAISVKDNFSDAITTMRNANNGFNKDLEGTQKAINEFVQKQDALHSLKAKFQTDLNEASNSLKVAKKAFSENNDEINRTNLEKAHENYNKIADDLKRLNSEAKKTQKSITEMSTEQSKRDNKAGGAGISKVMHGLAGAGMTKMVGDSLSGVADAYISSAFNDKAENMVGGVLGGMTSGAALGAMSGTGVPGMAIGAAVGGVAGAVNGAVKNFQSEDEAFKSVVKDSYNSIKQEESDTLTGGKILASAREGDLRSFTSLLGGSTAKAQAFQKSLIEVSRTKLNYDTAAGLSKEMLGLGDSTDAVKKKINDLNEAGTALNWSDSAFTTVSELLEQVEESGTVSARVLKTLEKNGIQAHDIIAKAFHIKKGSVDKDLGKMDASSVVNALYNGMGSKYAGAAKSFASSYEGLKKRAQSYEDDLNAKMGEGHNEEAKKGYQSEIKTMSGKVGKSLQEAYSMEGKFKAQLENSQKELLDNAYTSVTTGKVTGKFSSDHKTELKKLADDYKQSMAKASKGDQEAEEKAARDIEKAKIIAQNEYKATEGYQLELKGDKGLAEAIKNDTSLKQEYWDAGYEMGEQFSQGRVSGVQKSLDAGLHPLPIQRTPGIGLGMDPKFARNKVPGLSNATGIFRVPYNDYPALLHEDEKVLTGAEARSQKPSGGVNVEISGPVTVRKESDIDAIASVLYQKLQKARAVTP